MAGGYDVELDEAATRVTRSDTGVPFAVAKMAAIEEVVGVLGDIDEGDASGRLEEGPDVVGDLEAAREALEALTVADVDHHATPFSGLQAVLVDALAADVETAGAYEAVFHDGTARAVQEWIDGIGGIDDVIATAADDGYEKTEARARALVGA